MSDPKAAWLAKLGVSSLGGGDGGDGGTITAPPPAGDGGDGGTGTSTAAPAPPAAGDGGDGGTSTAPPPSGDGGDGGTSTAPPPSGDGGDGTSTSSSTPSASDLDQQFQAAVQSGDWQTAAEKLNGFNADDIKSELASLGADTIAKIHQGALDNPHVGSQSQVALMTGGAAPPAGDGGDGGTGTPPPVAGAEGDSAGRRSFDVPGLPAVLKKPFSVGSVEFEVEIKPTLGVSAIIGIDNADTTNLSSDEIQVPVVKFAKGWFDQEGTNKIQSKGMLDNAKFGRDGASLVATTFCEDEIGKITLTFTFIGLEGSIKSDASGKLALKVADAKGELEGKAVSLGNQEIEGLKLGDLEVTLGAEVDVAPNWWETLAKWAGEQALKQVGKDAGEAVVAGVSGEVVIAGSILIVGLGTIAAGIYEVVQGWEISDIGQGFDAKIATAKDGFKTAMCAGAAPSDPSANAGYTVGTKNYQALFAKAQQDNPSATDDDINKAIAARADDAVNQAGGAIEGNIRIGMWDNYLAQHTTMLGPNDARYAFAACFDYDRTFEHGSYDGQWDKYVQQHPTLSKLA